MFAKFAKMFSPLLSDYKSQVWSADLKGYIFMLVALIGVPLLVTYIVYLLGKVNTEQMGRTFGNDNQVVVGGLGNLIHELEICCLAKIVGHSLQDVHLTSWKDLSHFKAVASVEHVWVSRNLFQSLGDFFIGVLPLYITGSLLWGIQILFGGAKFHLTPYPGGVFGWKKLLGMFLNNFVSAYSTGHIILNLVFFIIVLLVASTAFAITWSEFRRALSSSLLWCMTLFVIWVVLIFAHVMPSITIGLWAVMSYSVVLLAHIFMYLIVMIAIATFFHLLDLASEARNRD